MIGEGSPPRSAGGRDMLKVVFLNVNGLRCESKRKEVLEMVRKGRMDVVGLQETHMKGCGVGGNDCELWEGMEGGVVWCGVDEKSKGRGREGCALLMSPRVWESTEVHGWKGSRIVWAVGKIGIVKYAWM